MAEHATISEFDRRRLALFDRFETLAIVAACMIAQNETVAEIERYPLIAAWPDLPAFQDLLNELELIRHAELDVALEREGF